MEPTFAKAAIAREKRSPTGLPFDPHAVALPHAEPAHVRSPAIALATLATPVRFRQMGDPSVVLEVSIVVMPALTAKEQAGAHLSRIIEWLQSADVRAALMRAEGEAEIVGLFQASPLAGGTP